MAALFMCTCFYSEVYLHTISKKIKHCESTYFIWYTFYELQFAFGRKAAEKFLVLFTNSYVTLFKLKKKKVYTIKINTNRNGHKCKSFDCISN